MTQFYLSGHNMALTGSLSQPELGDAWHSVMHAEACWGNNLSGTDSASQLGDLGDTLTRLRLGAAEESRGNTDLTGCVPRSLSGATDATDDLGRAGSAGLSICP